MDKFEWFQNEFANLSTDKQVEVFNKYCELSNCYEDEIYPLDEFNKMFSNYKPLEVARMACANSHRINFSDDYFVVTWNGFKTFDNPYYYIEQYLSYVFDCEDAWDTYIELDDFVDYTYHRFLYLKPNEMDDDDFYTIVNKAASKCNTEDDFENAIKETLSKNVN